MGVDIRDIPAEAVSAIPDKLRHAGFAIEVRNEPDSQHPQIILTLVICRRGKDVQRLGWGPSGQPGVLRIGIGNVQGWRRSVRDRRSQLQAEVTSIIEASGGYWPFTD